MIRRMATAVACVVLLGAAACTSGSTNRPAGGRAKEPLTRFLAPTDPTTPLEFGVVLKVPHQQELDQYLQDVSDPTSPRYRHFLDADAYGRRFGLSDADLVRTERILAGAGLDVVHTYPQRTAIDLRGTAGDVEALFGVRMGDFRERGGRLFHSPLGTPVVPSSLRDTVQAVSGLNGAPRPRKQAVPSGGLKPADVEKAYDIGPLHDAGIDGHGMTIAIASFASFRQSDVDRFDQSTGTEGPRPKIVPVNGGSDETTSAGSGEVNLDLDVIRGVAPKAQILSYEAPITDLKSFVDAMSDVIDRIVEDGRVDIVSISWGLCDVPALPNGQKWLTAADRLRSYRSFQAAVAAGISVFVASGDDGAYDCQHYDLSFQNLSVDWPESFPWVVSVGGTNLSVRQDGRYLQEAGWEDILERSGTGGGLNPSDPRPSWQTGPGVVNEFSDGKRQVPDVAGPADPSTGFFTVSPSEGGQAQAGVAGGTSASTPFWASSMLLIEQYAAKQGVRNLGFVAPMLYQIASHQNPKFPSFHDVTLGGNRFYDATPGWDYATGLGSPDVFNLARAVVDYVKTHPRGAAQD